MACIENFLSSTIFQLYFLDKLNNLNIDKYIDNLDIKIIEKERIILFKNIM